MKESEEAQEAGHYIKTIKDPDKRIYAQRYFFYLLGYDLKPPNPRPLKEEEARELQAELDKFFQSQSSQYSSATNLNPTDVLFVVDPGDSTFKLKELVTYEAYDQEDRRIQKLGLKSPVVVKTKFKTTIPEEYTQLSPEEIQAFRKGRPAIDAGLYNLIERLKNAGYYTTQSCSGLAADHHGDKPAYGYIKFVKTDAKKVKNIVQAASQAGFEVEDLGTEGFVSWVKPSKLVIYQEIGMKMSTHQREDDEIRAKWSLFEQGLFKNKLESQQYSTTAEPALKRLIDEVPDVDDPSEINYWKKLDDKWVYLEGWSDACLTGTSFPPIEDGGWDAKIQYIKDLTPGILERKAKEYNRNLIRGGFVEKTEEDYPEYLYGVTYGVYEEKNRHSPQTEKKNPETRKYWVEIQDPGSSSYVRGAVIPYQEFEAERKKILERGGKLPSIKIRHEPPPGNGNGDKQLPATVEAEPVPEKYRDLTPFIDLPLPPGTDFLPAVVPQEGERKIDVVMRQLKDGVEGIQDSAQFRLFLTTMAKFHDYSIGNQILIMLQRADATRVAGFMTWKDLGRWVKKGASGIAILAPVIPPKPKKEEDEEEVEIVPSPVYFKVVHVFDISQTEGKPLPEFDVPVLTGEANEELFSKVLTMAKDQGLDVSFEPRPHMEPSIKGMYSAPKSIWVRPEESKAQQLKSFLHEIAHYYSEGVFRIPRRDAETIAESAAFAVGAHYGFDSGVRSFPYVALWAQDKKTLSQNLNTIRKVADTMLHALEGTKSEMLVQVFEEPSAILKIVWGHLKCRKPKPVISIRRQHSTGLYWPDENKITIREDSWRKMHPGERKLIVLHEALHACGAGHEPGFRTATDTMAMLLYKQIWGEDEDWRNFITELERRLARFLRSPSLLPDDELLLAVEYLAQTEGDPIKKFCCRFSDACAPADLLEEGKFLERISWLRHHYKEKHPGMWGKQPAVEYLPDSAEFVAQTIVAAGYREKLDDAFQEAIARVRQKDGASG